MQVEPEQLVSILAAARSDHSISIGNLIAMVSVAVGVFSLSFTWQQRAIARREYVAKLHLHWWSNEFEKDRGIVWREMRAWRQLKDGSPVIKHYTEPGSSGWDEQSDERRAHAKMLFFFADLNSLLERRLIDKDLTFRFFGPSQYDFFREYFAAIRTVRLTRPMPPRWIAETEEFERRLDAWKASHPSQR